MTGILRISLAVVAFACAVLCGRPAQAQDLLSYLVQAECRDASGVALAGVLPFEPACVDRVPARAGAALAYRRHDWPTRADARGQSRGYQAQDATLGTLLGRPAAIHGFDFGDDGTRRFGTFDRGRGDGGQIVVVDADAAYIVMTEDAGGGMQWFRSPDCANGAPGWRGWLLAQAQGDTAWQSRIVRLRIARTAGECPSAFDASFTRWRRAAIALPWREASTGVNATVPADVLISEHYGGSSMDDADHLERFFLARDLGLVRWERWEQAARSRRIDPSRPPVAASDGRCPRIEGSDPPAKDWVMADCRQWTNIVRAAAGAGLPALQWPDAALR